MHTAGTPLEKRQIKYAAGSSSPSNRFANVGRGRPFIQQMDIIFPSPEFPSSRSTSELIARFAGLPAGAAATYTKGHIALSDVVDWVEAELQAAGASAEPLAQSETKAGREEEEEEEGSARAMLAATATATQFVSLPVTSAPGALVAEEQDAWCIDHRGVLTLVVEKTTYERLGLVGRKLPWKGRRDWHVLQFSLRKNAESVANRAKRAAALKGWDARRQADGLGLWGVAFCRSASSSREDYAFFERIGGRNLEVKAVECQVVRLADVHVPKPVLTPQPAPKARKRMSAEELDEEEDWLDNAHGLMEWLALAGLGSQRIKAIDRVDPYIAVYEPPDGSYIGNVTHLRWRGLLHPEFVQTVVDASLKSLEGGGEGHFVGLTLSSLATSPVSYIPNPGAGSVETPLRLPRSTAEDTLSIIGAANGLAGTWVSAESVGQFDGRTS